MLKSRIERTHDFHIILAGKDLQSEDMANTTKVLGSFPEVTTTARSGSAEIRPVIRPNGIG